MSDHRTSVLFSKRRRTYSEKILSIFSSVYALYPLNEAAGVTAEEVVNNYDGTLNGPTLNAIAGPGPSMGNAAFYDGLVDYCQLPAASLDGPFDPNLGTMMIWMKVANAGVWTDGGSRVVAIIGTDANNCILVFKQNPNQISFLVNAGAVSHQRLVATTSTDWMMTAITWNKAQNRIRAYLNGVQQGADIAYAGTWLGNLSTNYTRIGNQAGSFAWHG